MDTKERCVAGRVKCRSNRDGSTTFTVASEKRFTVSSLSAHAEALRKTKRALVRYEENERNPRIVLVVPNPSSRLIREHQAQCRP